MASHGHGKRDHMRPPKRLSKKAERLLKEKEAAEAEGRVLDRTSKQKKSHPGAHKTKDLTPAEMERKLIFTNAMIGATNLEIASSLGWSTAKLTRLYDDVLVEARAKGDMRLRTLQWRSATNLSDRMLVWLGKQRLSQREVAKFEIDWGTMTEDELREIEQGRLPARLLAQITGALASSASITSPTPQSDENKP